MKQVYLAPAITVTPIILENCIAAGSAQVNPSDSNNEMKDSWDTSADNDQNVEW